MQTLLFILLASILTKWWILVPVAFLSAFSFMHINSAPTDKRPWLNTLYVVVGILAAVAAIVEFIQLSHT